MRLVYEPMEELKTLIEQSRRNPRVRYISVTKHELRGLLKHAHVIDVFPKYISEKNRTLKLLRSKMVEVRERLEQPPEDLEEGTEYEITDEDKFESYRVLDELEKKELDLKDKVPSQLIEDGYIIKVTLR